MASVDMWFCDFLLFQSGVHGTGLDALTLALTLALALVLALALALALALVLLCESVGVCGCLLLWFAEAPCPYVLRQAVDF